MNKRTAELQEHLVTLWLVAFYIVYGAGVLVCAVGLACLWTLL